MLRGAPRRAPAHRRRWAVQPAARGVPLIPFVLIPPEAFAAAATAATKVDRHTAHHLGTVLRLRDGAAFQVADGAGNVAPARLVGARSSAFTLELTGPAEHVTRPARPITVAQGLATGRKVDEVVRVLTELGVDELWVLATERSVRELDGERADKAVARWRSVVAAACGQARRPWLPVVVPPRSVAEAAAAVVAGGLRGVVAHVGVGEGIRPVLGRLGTPENGLLAAVGPESGWASQEIERWRQVGVVPVSLGASVLRTEHAGVVAATAVAYHLGRMDRTPDVSVRPEPDGIPPTLT